jgi:hypothetical protein
MGSKLQDETHASFDRRGNIPEQVSQDSQQVIKSSLKFKVGFTKKNIKGEARKVNEPLRFC